MLGESENTYCRNLVTPDLDGLPAVADLTSYPFLLLGPLPVKLRVSSLVFHKLGGELATLFEADDRSSFALQVGSAINCDPVVQGGEHLTVCAEDRAVISLIKSLDMNQPTESRINLVLQRDQASLLSFLSWPLTEHP